MHLQKIFFPVSAAIAIAMSSVTAHAEEYSLVEDTPTCTSSFMYTTLLEAQINDEAYYQSLLLEDACTVLPAGSLYDPIEQHAEGYNRVRVELNGRGFMTYLNLDVVLRDRKAAASLTTFD